MRRIFKAALSVLAVSGLLALGTTRAEAHHGGFGGGHGGHGGFGGGFGGGYGGGRGWNHGGGFRRPGFPIYPYPPYGGGCRIPGPFPTPYPFPYGPFGGGYGAYGGGYGGGYR
jgi:hypothetical protein